MTVLFVIAQKDFRDEEFAEPKRALEDAGYKVEVTSVTTEIAEGTLGMTVHPDIAIKDADAGDYEMVVLVGGKGAPALAGNRELMDLLGEFRRMDRPIGAICIAPTILAKAGLLEGKRATVYKTDDSVATLKSGGAVFVDEPVVRDGMVITANGPKAAPGFGNEIVKVLSGLK